MNVSFRFPGKKFLIFVQVSNAGYLLECADKYHASMLKQCCLDFIVSNYAEVSNIPEFKDQLRSPDLMHEVIQALAKKISPAEDR